MVGRSAIIEVLDGVEIQQFTKAPAMFPWDEYSASRLLTVPPAQLRHAELTRVLPELCAIRPDGMKLQEIGKSYENRPIFSATMGTGPVRVMAWSQMHGNEPTHTAVLLDLIDLLQRRPESAISQTILSGCTLTLVPMLNPDGAERYMRRNAQDIDINRDALHLESPEGRLLRHLVEQVRPHFAFNLHNQQARTSVDGSRVAALSLLVPPIDEPDTQTEWTQQAKQVASVFVASVRSHCQGMISRYDADFMPRCFGEWVQQQKIATLTVEAGGWSTIDSVPLVQLHFVGLVNVLLAIATGAYADFTPAEYDSLPRSSEHYLFDVIVRKAEIVTGGKQAEFKADLGINFTHSKDCVPVERCGRIDDLGDLCVTSGKREFATENLWCVPGRIVYEPSITPRRLPTDEQAQQLLSQGVTTVIGKVELTEPAEIAALTKLSQVAEWPLNIGFVAAHSDSAKQDAANREQIVRAIAGGVLGLVAADEIAAWQEVLAWFQLPFLKAEQLPLVENQPATVSELSTQTHDVAKRLGLKDRGTIKLGAAADLLFYSQTRGKTVSPNDLRRVMLGGRVVLDYGKFLPGASGELLLR